ncbi:MAG: inorganic diphosphatase [Candidatus Aenigmarchaeota archaeon]|nr:inorganic diphosphatase [Candidatus Aenigmarchaeota archaeon]
MNLMHDIDAGSEEEINVVVENVKGSSNKIEYDNERGCFMLDRVLYSPVFWPFDYGFIPRTWHEDEDPVDVVLLTTYPTFPGCVVKARPIGVIIMEDEKGIDDKIVAVPIKDPRFKNIKSIDDLNEHLRKEIQDFFESYKKLEPGKFVKFKEWQGVEKAKEIIRKAKEEYKKKFGR